MGDMNRPYGARSVVVIDDDRDQADVLAILLEFEGYKVYATVDPHEGLLWIRTHLPDLVLLDFAMPQMSGAELARLLKESPQTLSLIHISEPTRLLSISYA